MVGPAGSMVEKPSAVPRQGLAFGILAVVIIAAAFAPIQLLVGIGILVAIPVAGYFALQAIDGNADMFTLVWACLFPLGYYFLSFPHEQSIVTFDRVTALMMAVALAFCPQSGVGVIPNDLRKSALAWIGFLAVALVSVLSIGNVLTPGRVWLDAFLLPAIVAWYVIACFPVRRYLRVLHVLACVAAVYSAAIGAAEVALGTDLLPLPGAGDTFAGAQDVLVLRVNGPFLSNNSFGLIGLVSFCLIWFLRSAIAQAMPRWQKALNALGVTAALIAAMLPLFRSIFATVALIFFVDLFRRMSLRQRAIRLGILGLMMAGVLALMLSVPELFQERVSDSGNISARIAQQKQNFQLFLDHPIVGVGFANFVPAAAKSQSANVAFDDVIALGSPHSNLGAVLAETGLAGFLPYAFSNVLLIIAFWKLRQSSKVEGRLAWTFFMYVFLSYWVSGLALTSGYYSDLNLWFMFSVAVIYKYATSAPGVSP